MHGKCTISKSKQFTNLFFILKIRYWNEEEKERSRPFLVGEIVAALHEDQRFYRARIIDYDEDSIELHTDLRKDQRAKVFFVDYGRSTYVDIADIRTINPDHLSLPFQAIGIIPLFGICTVFENHSKSLNFSIFASYGEA